MKSKEIKTTIQYHNGLPVGEVPIPEPKKKTKRKPEQPDKPIAQILPKLQKQPKRKTSEHPHRFPYRWTLAGGYPPLTKGKVFSSFICGGGSTMGYKLAGFEVLGGIEIDKEMAARYEANHKPKHLYVEGIQEFKLRPKKSLPKELFNLDIFDGSPPCSSFSMAGNREDDWGKEKVFKEGQALQTLDTLFFDFIDTVELLKPKVAVAENVKGLLMGNARQYVRRIYEAFDKAGYIVQHWLFDASRMGVPQKRERVFFVALRKDLCAPFMERIDMFTMKPKINLTFNEHPIKFGEYRSEVGIDGSSKERGALMDFRIKTDKSCNDINLRIHGKTSGFNSMILHDNEVCGTITAGELNWRYCDGRLCTNEDYLLTGSYPLDYDFGAKQNDYSFVKYMVGMSVPPVMTAQIATEIYEQWLSKIK